MLKEGLIRQPTNIKELPSTQKPEPAVKIITSGLTAAQEEVVALKVKNQGKCCEGGSEGWSG